MKRICLSSADVALIIFAVLDSVLGYFCAHMSCHYRVINVNDVNDTKLFFEKKSM